MAELVVPRIGDLAMKFNIWIYQLPSWIPSALTWRKHLRLACGTCLPPGGDVLVQLHEQHETVEAPKPAPRDLGCARLWTDLSGRCHIVGML